MLVCNVPFHLETEGPFNSIFFTKSEKQWGIQAFCRDWLILVWLQQFSFTKKALSSGLPSYSKDCTRPFVLAWILPATVTFASTSKVTSMSHHHPSPCFWQTGIRGPCWLKFSSCELIFQVVL